MRLERLREWRESRGLTQRELASDAGVGEVTVARVEAGTSVRPNTARKLADVLGVTVADLMERPPVPLGEGGEGRSAAGPSPEIDFSRLDDLVESRAAAYVLVVNRAALVKAVEEDLQEALENVRDHVWSVEDAQREIMRTFERALESEARKQEQTYTGAIEQAYSDHLELLRGQVGKWSDSYS